jgi:hypothetical protein
MCQIAADALAAVLLFLIVAELLPLSAGLVAGLLAAFSPQLAWNSVLLLPDSISVLPVLLAVYVLTRAVKNPRLLSFIAVGALIGVSCWLRANTMLMTFFVAGAVLLLLTTAKRWQLALAVVCGTLLIVLPLTIRNAIVFHRFIPLSLGAGQTFLEGIADYDKEGRLGIPSTDMGIMKQESEIYQRPDYYGTLFNPDGVERERARLSRGFAVIRSHPIWFAGVMAKRASSMVRLERARLMSTEPAMTHRLDDIDKSYSVTSISADAIVSHGNLAPGASATINMDGMTFSLVGNSERYGRQFSSPDLSVNSGRDYAVVIPLRVSDGRMRINIENATGKVYATQVVELAENSSATDWNLDWLRFPFASLSDEQLRVVWVNEASTPRPAVEVGSINLYELGPARFLWTRYPRLLIHGIQKLFLTAIMLPLAIIGLLLLILHRQRRALVILSVVPIYFFLVQSIVHTEYRYVLAVVYFLFAFAGVAVGSGIQLIIVRLGTRLRRRSLLATESVPSA